MMKSIHHLNDLHKGKTCYIIGTGPSARELTSEDFGDGFVIAINSSISIVEALDLTIPVYCQYKDGNYPEPQCTVMTCDNCPKGQPAPTKAALLLHVHHAANCFPEYEPKYYFSNADYELQVVDFSQKSAIRNAELMGASDLVFYGFDAITRGDCSKYSGKGYPEAYKKQAKSMRSFDYRLPYSYKDKLKGIDSDGTENLIDLVYVLGSGSQWKDNEIRFSLRSVAKNLKGYRNIYVVGSHPSFLQNVIHIEAEDEFDPAVNADGNMTLKLLKVCALEELSDEFLFMNDDFIILKPMWASEIKTMHKGDMKDRPASYWKEQFYRHRLHRTFETLQGRGETTLQYDYHAPMLINKHDFISVMEQYDFTEGIGLTFRSIYGNTMKLEAERLTNQKRTIYKHYTFNELLGLTDPALFLGYNDQGLGKTLIYFLIKNFPERSTFEVNDPDDRIIEITLWLESDRNYAKGVEIFKKYLHGVSLVKMFEAGETTVTRKKLEYKMERILDDIN